MKKLKILLSAILASALSLSLFASCGGGTSSTDTTTTQAPAATTTTQAAASADTTQAPADTTAAPSVSGNLNIWSFTNELQTFALAFQKAHPEIKVQYTMIPMTDGEYQTKVQSAISSGQVPDVIGLEASFVKSYVESDMLMDLTDLKPLADQLQCYQFMLDVGTYNGQLKGFTYQATPGALFYRRSLAKEYFGTDDPVEIQKLLSDMDKFQQAAETVKQKSNGNTYMVCSTGDFTSPIYANRQQPWVVDNKLTIDPQVDYLMNIAKTFRDNGYEAQATQWQEGWFAGMKDTLTDASGNPKKVFCYFLPTWGLPYVLMQNAPDTSGDWAMCNGPLPYSWGGTWMGVMNGAKNVDAAKEFIKFATLNEQTLKDWALGTYTNAYLKAIDPTIGDTQAQGAGDFVVSQKVVNEITSQFDNAETSKYLGGQNNYKAFAETAPTISLKLMQGTDDAIQRAFNDPLNNYVTGSATKEEALQQFKDAVRAEFPDLIIE